VTSEAIQQEAGYAVEGVAAAAAVVAASVGDGGAAVDPREFAATWKQGARR